MFCLFHTIEEIVESCRHAKEIISKLYDLAPAIRKRLGLPAAITFLEPTPQDLADFIADSKRKMILCFWHFTAESVKMERFSKCLKKQVSRIMDPDQQHRHCAWIKCNRIGNLVRRHP
jgi:hypothetical protein